MSEPERESSYVVATAQRERVNLNIMRIIREMGMSIAFPTRSIHVEILPDGLGGVLGERHGPQAGQQTRLMRNGAQAGLARCGFKSTLGLVSDSLWSVVDLLRHFPLVESQISVRAFRLFGMGLLSSSLICVETGCATRPTSVQHVVHISVDGLRPDVITMLGESNLPNFFRLRREGAFTDNARTDDEFTVTLPNHTSQLTGRPVLGDAGHGWTNNGNPPEGATLASNKGQYVAGAFDVAHDHGLRTAHYASKSKFSLFETSWGATNGAPDVVPPDNGRRKLDVSVIKSDTSELVRRMLDDQSNEPFGYVFLHFRDPDSAGHASGWSLEPETAYGQSVKHVDDQLGRLLTFIGSDPRQRGRTAVLLTSDHGGLEKSHGNVSLPQNYIIPFYVWGPGVTAGGDLYLLNSESRVDPGSDRVPISAPLQPIRNGDAANLALKLLGLPPVPGSTIGVKQDLAVGGKIRPAAKEHAPKAAAD